MSNWLDGPRAAFDVETTGRDPQQARLVTASIVLLDASGNFLEEHEWLADPGVDIPAEAAQIHGISTERARSEGAPVEQVVAATAAVLRGYFARGIPVMAFNAPYDFTVLRSESRRHGVPALRERPVIDPLILDKQVDRFRKGKRTLVAMCEHYGITLLDAHTSAADAMATLQLAVSMAASYPELQIPAAELHQAQIRWAADQAASFQEYLRRSRPDAVVNGSWPAAGN
ncbi:exonuclease domain-containing protein [Psychromicrobium silvestre]|uniref:exonuclease domain-containing protein n=1 Tax=Psychromicrobium silvestre TaxID=1645614 RepID=UPI0015CB882E